MRNLTLACVTLAFIGCTHLTSTQKFEMSIRSYETGLKGAIGYYDQDGDGVRDRQLSYRERDVVIALVSGGREVRNAGMNLVLDCVTYKEVNGTEECPVETERIIGAAAESLGRIATDLNVLFSESE